MSMSKNTSVKHPVSLISVTLIRLLLVAIGMSLLNALVYLIVFAAQGKLYGDELNSFLTSTLLLLPIPPVLLFLIGSIISVVTLSKKQITIKNLAAPLIMSSVDTICIDKASALTSGKLAVKKSIPLKVVGDDYIAQAISNVLCATNNQSQIALALKKEFDLELTSGVIDILSSNENGCIGASFKGGKTFIIGDPNYLPLVNQPGIIKRCEEYFKSGHSVVALGESKELISGGKFNGTLEAVMLIVIKNCVRDGASETFKWFQDNNIDVKVITSDDPISSSLLATEAGINNADKYVSLEGVNFEKIRQIADIYSVFGDMNQDQKLFLIKVLQEKGRTVATVADGDENTSILKQSNCSLSFLDGVSHAVLKNPNTSLLRYVVCEGRRFSNNLRRIVSLFLTNAFFIFVVSLMFVFAFIGEKDAAAFPYSFNNLLLLEIALALCAPLSLLFCKNSNDNYDGFSIKDILQKSIPSSLALIVSTCLLFVLFLLQKASAVSWGIYSIDTFVAMSIITMSLLSIIVSFGIYSPLTKYRKIVLIGLSAFTVTLLTVSGIIAYSTNGTDPILMLPFSEMSGPAYLISTIITVVFSAIHLFVYRLISIRKGDYLENEN